MVKKHKIEGNKDETKVAIVQLQSNQWTRSIIQHKVDV